MPKILSEEEAKKKETKKTQNIFDKDYYIVDCENFTYFARKVRVIGISSGGYNDEIEYITNLPHPFAANEHRSMYFNELTRFKTFKEAQERARHLNEKVEKISNELDIYPIKLNDKETITISLEEYKELLIIKGKYEELKKQQPLIFHGGFVENGTTILPYKDIKTTDPIFNLPYKITCNKEV